jgi:hypothetical protein
MERLMRKIRLGFVLRVRGPDVCGDGQEREKQDKSSGQGAGQVEGVVGAEEGGCVETSPRV